MATVSLCMIVKNEEAVLARCLESVRAAMDEIIVVDTGSADRTREIAAQYADRVYDFAWIDDFSAARNFSFSKATMDFTMWLDADDVLLPEDLDAFLKLKRTLPDDVDAVMMRYHTAFDEQGQPTFTYYRERLVRTNAPHEWKGRVHEALVHEGRTIYSDVAVTHRSNKRTYPDRNLRIYERQIAEGEPLAPRDVFYYGRELYYHGAYERACVVLQTFLDQAGLGRKQHRGLQIPGLLPAGAGRPGRRARGAGPIAALRRPTGGDMLRDGGALDARRALSGGHFLV